MRIALFFFLFISQFSILGQPNLVLNPSFEDTLSMTNDIIYPLCKDWWNPNDGTSDYHTPFINELIVGRGSYFEVPCNSLGCIDANHGQACLGLVTYHSTGPGKEWAQGYLSKPLVMGETYCVSLWLASGDSCGFKTCDFHVAFTEESVNNAQLVGTFGFPNAISFDTFDLSPEHWTNYQAQYVATGNEQFIYLGSNIPNELITCAEPLSDGWLWNSNYVLVDNVSVRIDAICGENSISGVDLSHEAVLYPNPTTDVATVGNLNGEAIRIDLLDGMGRWCITIEDPGQDALLDLRPFERGVYFLRIEGVQNVKVLKVIKQ